MHKPPRTQTPLLDLLDDNEATFNPVNSTPDPKAQNAVQDDRPRASRATSGTARKAQGQQLFTFDDESDGNRTAVDPFGDHQEAPVRRSDGFGRSAEKRSVGSSPAAVAKLPADGRFGNVLPRSGDGLSASSYTAWLNARKKDAHRPLLFDVDEQPPTDVALPSKVDSKLQSKAVAKHPLERPSQKITSGDKAKARDILQAVRIVKQLGAENRQATAEEVEALRRFGGFGPVALSLFPDPISGKYKDASWELLGLELVSLMSPEDYESAKRTTFNAFYTSPEVMKSMHSAFTRLGVPDNCMILEPGCGIGNFMSHASENAHFIGVELDRTSGQIARAVHPKHDIRIENFRDTKLADESLDAVIGNVPFANIKLDHRGNRFALHDYFFAKSVDALKPGGVLALVTSHFTLDKQNAAIREYLAGKADFVGAIRLPAEAFKHQGTKVVTDIVFLRKRQQGSPANHIDPEWLSTAPLELDGIEVPVNRYFLNHPEMVLGTWTRENQLYGDEGFSVRSSGNLTEQLQAAIARLPEFQTVKPTFVQAEPAPARFTRPPPLKHVTEGSYFIGDDRKIYQIEHGQSKPVTHGSVELRADGTMMGKRLASLITLRDAARLVLQAQNEAWPESERSSTRRDLNQRYEAFVHSYGPINKTTFSETRDKTTIRRMPNLVKFRDDPDAMLVMSLEDYDEVTAKATKASIFNHDVVGPKHAVTHVASAEEGLLVSLDQKGQVDLTYISDLYGKSESEIITELGDLICLNPEGRHWETADVYLSGNVRAKLLAAENAGSEFVDNAAKLRSVQPPDVLPGDIDAKLGSPWIPTSDVQAFAANLFHVASDAVAVAHLKKDATWSVGANYTAEKSVQATSEFGTSRANGTHLLELALNMKSPTVYDVVCTDHGEERIVNQEETLAAREKQKSIKEEFKNWVFADPIRTERLVRIYNDTYNNLRPRLFDGSHLEFSGMNQTINLRPHQKNAIWRAMSSGNTLLAHAVGAGKTFTMAATGMKLKQAGLVKKPMYVVPNHMLEQFSREFMQLYPNAHLLVASKEDMSRERRKFLTAKIASGDWDGIVVTHSSFERIGMSRKYQEQFLNDQIWEYTELLADAVTSDTAKRHRNLIKTIEKQKAAREIRLKDLAAEDKKDDGLVFDELGVDHIFIDEAHYFKNLETPTKMDRVAGIQTSGSQRAFDLFMKSRYLGERHPGHGVTFATGTPISNTMVEMYNMQRFLDSKGLSDRGIEHFDAWAANFGEVVDTMEISPDGASLRPRSRFAKFNNLPELQQMFRAFADVQTAEMLDLPRPKLAGGQPTTVSCPMSDSQAVLQQELIERYERIRSQKIDPRVDNALAITTDGRKLALDARMLDAGAADDPESKINALVQNVEQIWRDTADKRGTQLVFCDMGVHQTAWGFSAYEDIVNKLVAGGIPRDQIATMGDAESDAKKQALFEKVRNGSVRVLIGSTQKMGTGTNVQKRLVALHHLDAPWKPAEVEQRDGRILRQGNLNKEVAIYRYVTQGSFDAYMWQALETKARFISQIMTGNNCLRSADDIGSQELSYAEVKAIASGNPAVLTLAETDAELQRLLVLRKNHVDDQYLIRRKLKELPETIERLSTRLTHLSHDQATFSTQDHPDFRIDGQAVFREVAIERIASRLDRLPEHVSQATSIDLGDYHGIRFGIQINPFGPREVYLKGAAYQTVTLSREHAGPRAVMNALSRLADSLEAQRVRTEQDLALSKQQLGDYQDRFGAVFPHEAYVTELTRLRDQLKLALSGGEANMEAAEQLNAIQLANQIQELRQSQAPDVSSKRDVGQVQQSGEIPVTTRVRLHLEATPSETELNPRLPDVDGQEAHVIGDDASGTYFRDKVTLNQHERELAI